jgi:hypothetical protein
MIRTGTNPLARSAFFFPVLVEDRLLFIAIPPNRPLIPKNCRTLLFGKSKMLWEAGCYAREDCRAPHWLKDGLPALLCPVLPCLFVSPGILSFFLGFFFSSPPPSREASAILSRVLTHTPFPSCCRLTLLFAGYQERARKGEWVPG